MITMKTHEEILEPLAGECQGQIVIEKNSALIAMQQAVDQALAWVPVDEFCFSKNNLPYTEVLCMSTDRSVFLSSDFKVGFIGVFATKTINKGNKTKKVYVLITHYFDPSTLKTPNP